jgi:hypothetical protein
MYKRPVSLVKKVSAELFSSFSSCWSPRVFILQTSNLAHHNGSHFLDSRSRHRPCGSSFYNGCPAVRPSLCSCMNYLSNCLNRPRARAGQIINRDAVDLEARWGSDSGHSQSYQRDLEARGEKKRGGKKQRHQPPAGQSSPDQG